MGWVMKSVVVASTVALLAIGSASASKAQDGAGGWTGFYGGAHIGYGSGDSDGTISGEFEKVYDLVPDIGTTAGRRARDAELEDATSNHVLDGVLGGLHVGGNVQFSNFVFGVEGSYDWTDVNGEKSLVPEASINAETQTALDNNLTELEGNPTVRVSTDIDDIASIRGRIGVVTSNALIYATGGWAWADAAVSVASLDPAPGFPAGAFSASDDLSGYVIGGGVEFKVSRNFAIRAELLYFDLGSISYEFESDDPATNNIEEAVGKQEIDLTQIRVGATYYLN